eukprot:PRCOL_00000430-RA
MASMAVSMPASAAGAAASSFNGRAPAFFVEAKASNRYKKKLRVKFRSYNVKAIEKAVDTLLDLAEEHDTDVSGPVPLPTKIRRFCLLRSPHVNKDSREHFEVRTHSRLVDLMEPEAGIIDGLMTLELPPGVDPEISVIEARA